LINFIGRQDSDWVGPEVNFGGLRPVPIPGITDVPIHHIKRPAFSLFFCACLRRQQAEQHCRGPGFRWPVRMCALPGLARGVH